MKQIIFFILLTLSLSVNAAEEILAAQTASGTSTAFNVFHGASVTIIIAAASGHTASEFSDVQISHDGGTTFADLYENGSQVRLHITNTAVTVYGPGRFRVVKDTTSNATSISLSTLRSI